MVVFAEQAAEAEEANEIDSFGGTESNCVGESGDSEEEHNSANSDIFFWTNRDEPFISPLELHASEGLLRWYEPQRVLFPLGFGARKCN